MTSLHQFGLSVELASASIIYIIWRVEGTISQDFKSKLEAKLKKKDKKNQPTLILYLTRPTMTSH
jgi:hypothetical protein